MEEESIITSENNFWQKIIHTNKIIKYFNRNLDFISIEILEANNYQNKKRYQIRFNKYILGIFKTKQQAFSFIEKWIAKHT
jgi:hypothetical protein